MRLVCLALCLALLPLSTVAAYAAGDGGTVLPVEAVEGGEPLSPAEIPVKRGEVLLLLWQSAGAVPYDKTAHPFTDLEGRDDLGQAAGWAYELGLVKGVGDGLFAPDRPMTREELATLLRRNHALLGLDTFLPDGAALCNDYADISPWADDSLYWACIMGKMDWRGTRLAPLDYATRAEAEGLFPPLYGSEMEYRSELEYPQDSSQVGFSISSQVGLIFSMPSQVPYFSSTRAQVTYQ